MTGPQWSKPGSEDEWHVLTTPGGITVELSPDGTRVAVSNSDGDAIDLTAAQLVGTADALLAAHVKRSRL